MEFNISVFTAEAINNLQTKNEIKVNGNNIQLNHHQHELKIQELIKTFIEQEGSMNVIVESTNDIPEFREHNVLILKDLKENIKRVNQNKIKELINIHPELTEKYLVNLFFNDFVKKFNLCSNDNVLMYKLYFNLSEKQVDIPLSENKFLTNQHYQVLDLVDYSNNVSKFIKEKRLVFLNNEEFIDFAQYIGGLPMFGIEVKTPKTGLEKALKDNQEKHTYGYFMAIIGTDGTNVFINSNPKSKVYFKWRNYGDNGKITKIGLVDLIREFVFSVKNSLFYVHRSIFITKDGKNTFLKNLRVQQYFVSKKIVVEFNKIKMDRKNNILNSFNKYIKHHTRTGKSLTFKSVANITFNIFPELFSKIIFFTHDVSSVQQSIIKDFGDQKFEGKELNVVNSKADYKRKVLNPNVYGIFIVNMQKIDTSKIINKNYDILIFIDEVHTHQEGGLADIRDMQFPNASTFSATATPKMGRKDKKIIKKEFLKENGKKPTKEQIEEIYDKSINDITALYKGEKLDDLTPSEAIELELVVPLQYRKMKYKYQKKNNINIDDLEKIVETKIIEMYFEEESLEQTKLNTIELFQQHINDFEEKEEFETFISTSPEDSCEILLSNEIDTKNEILNGLFKLLKKDFKTFKSKQKRKAKNKVYIDFKMQFLDEKLNIIEKEVNSLRNELKDSYKPKFFWVVDSVEESIILLKEIKNRINKNKKDSDSDNFYNKTQNIYKGIRFAVDVSDYKELDKNDLKELEEEFGENSKPQDINGKVIYTYNKDADIIEDFETDLEGAVDVLILVKKRMMGYDNHSLTCVFLDKTIKDVKEMLQIATRPTTKTPGKKTGYLLDLTIGETNIDTFKSTYELYDNKDFESAVISDEYLESIYQNIAANMNNIKNVFKDKDTTKIKDFKNNESWYANKLIEHYNKSLIDDKVENKGYFFFIKEIKDDTVGLVNPKYHFLRDGKKFLNEEFESLLEINSHLYRHILNKEMVMGKDLNTISLTKNDIKTLIEDSFKAFSKDLNETIESIEKLFSVKDSTSKIIEKDEETKILLRNETVLKGLRIHKQDPRDIEPSIFKQLKEKLQNSEDISEEEFNEFQKEEEKLQKERKDYIDNNYNGNMNHYIVDFHLNSFFEKSFDKYDTDKLKIVIPIISKYFTEKIEKSLSLHQDLKEDILINKIIEEMNLNSSDFMKNIIDINILKELNYENEGNKVFWLMTDYKEFSSDSEKMYIIINDILVNKEIYDDNK